MFRIDSVDDVTGLQRMQVSRIDQHIVSGGKKYNLFMSVLPVILCLQSKVTWEFFRTMVSSLEFPGEWEPGLCQNFYQAKVLWIRKC